MKEHSIARKRKKSAAPVNEERSIACKREKSAASVNERLPQDFLGQSFYLFNTLKASFILGRVSLNHW